MGVDCSTEELLKPLEFELGMQGLHAVHYTKGFGNFSQEMNNTLQSALSGLTETSI